MITIGQWIWQRIRRHPLITLVVVLAVMAKLLPGPTHELLVWLGQGAVDGFKAALGLSLGVAQTVAQRNEAFFISLFQTGIVIWAIWFMMTRLFRKKQKK